MWAHYRATLLPVQTVILLLCASAYFVIRMPLAAVLITLVTLEVFSLLGAAWASRLRRKLSTPQALR